VNAPLRGLRGSTGRQTGGGGGREEEEEGIWHKLGMRMEVWRR